MLPIRSQLLSIVLTLVSLIGCTQKHDYNLVVALGILYLGSKHAYLHHLSSFYLIIIATIGVDIVQIIVLNNQSVFIRFVITILQIIIKIGIIVFMRSVASREEGEELQLTAKRSRRLSDFYH